jgi:homoserine dehydrogenase
MSTTKYVVLKFGGSVLHSQADLRRISAEIQRFNHQGIKVFAVVSAYYGVTETLIKQAREHVINPNSVAYAELIASGEFRSATDLVKELDQLGLNASCKTPADFAFTAQGSRSDARPNSIDSNSIILALEESPVVVMPGFSAIDQYGECVLLGRGGSDISAVCVAQALKLDSVRLLKDVDGLYDSDPNKYPLAQRLPAVDYQTAKLIGGELIQTEAIDFAASKNICIDVAAIGHSFASRIGPERTSEAAAILPISQAS